MRRFRIFKPLKPFAMKNFLLVLFVCASGVVFGQTSCPPPNAPSPACLTIDVSNVVVSGNGEVRINVTGGGTSIFERTKVDRTFVFAIKANTNYTVSYGGFGTYSATYNLSGAHSFSDSKSDADGFLFQETFVSNGCSCSLSAPIE